MKLIRAISDAVWGTPMIIFILAIGLYYSFALKFIQLGRLKEAVTGFIRSLKRSPDSFGGFTSALCATVGTGSITGVAAALSIGGAGAIFWMWVSAFFGMAIAYAEGYLSIKYRTQDSVPLGGMHYIIRLGLDSPLLAAIYALFATLACFGMGIASQTSTLSQSMKAGFSLPEWISSGSCAVIIFIAACIPQKSLNKACSVLLPPLAIGYIAVTLTVIFLNIASLPCVIARIFRSALGIKQAVGGCVGYTVKAAISQGLRRGVFSNEAGLGTTAAIHASAKGVSPVEQGYMNMLEVFIDTFVICTLTALAILLTDSKGDDSQAIAGFCREIFGSLSGKAVSVALSGFALATAIGWVSIGKSAYSYLTKGRLMPLYKALCIACAYIGGVSRLDGVIAISDIFNGLMALPSLTALWLLRSEVIGGSEPACRAKPRLPSFCFGKRV